MKDACFTLEFTATTTVQVTRTPNVQHQGLQVQAIQFNASAASPSPSLVSRHHPRGVLRGVLRGLACLMPLLLL